MKGFLQRFWTVAVSLGTLVALYLAADVAKLAWAFWLVVVAAMLVACVSTIGKQVLDLLVRVRNYPLILKRLAEREQEIADLAAQAAAATQTAKSRWRAGWEEGRKATLGVLAANRSEPPTLLSIADREGELALVATTDAAPIVGARYLVQVQLTGEVKGVVEVVEFDDGIGTTFLTCVQPTVRRFWTHLSEKVAYESTVPDGLILVPTTLQDRPLYPFEVSPTEAEEEPG